ncbi:MAG TPA: HIT family hydrolase [Deltaproteobacteria bacterium]|nr:MAG: HIT family hydrolase [Deltaproteobacteria bacterium GWA2_55_82]OGQ62478.1 MAG: HIT family hydrolase [Deltaproteobacteria bacterium RIFCSPLOWO2_02_FULL_55_12]OIJ73004.1 MAG: HIT family hydrolase [Deltaproteobacteria bacterium GWC2_55_46]HBG45985.1 HIT family hydrolase [Deltaproteobacteria bacterium]HCY11797.1 HIT family hydrolase [Deltaproteobacteria bacterium]
MRQMWAPWRSEYIHAEKEAGCVFCKATAARPGEGLVLFNGSVSVVVLNKFPYNSGHLMVAPSRHVAKVEELTPEESIDMFRLIRHCTSVLTKAMNPGGFNIGMNVGKAAGAGIDDHLHMHVVPRWNGDINFMPVLSDVKVIPEHLQKTLSLLLPFFERLSD